MGDSALKEYRYGAHLLVETPSWDKYLTEETGRESQVRLSPVLQEPMTQGCLDGEGWRSPESAKQGERFPEEAAPEQSWEK